MIEMNLTVTFKYKTYSKRRKTSVTLIDKIKNKTNPVKILFLFACINSKRQVKRAKAEQAGENKYCS